MRIGGAGKHAPRVFCLSQTRIRRFVAGMPEPADAPARPALANNTIPRAAIWAFGLALLAGLLALPFVIFGVLARTQNQAQGMTLAGMAGLPLDSRSLHATVRETRDKSTYAARYALDAASVEIVRGALPGRAAPDAAFFAELKKLSPTETGWQPAAGSTGPWRTAAGERSGHAWRAALDESASTLWILAERLPPAK